MGSTGERTTYAELDERSTPPGAGAAGPRRWPRATTSPSSWRTTARSSRWRGRRSARACYYTGVNSHLRPAEVQYVLDDCGADRARLVRAMADVVAGLDLSRRLGADLGRRRARRASSVRRRPCRRALADPLADEPKAARCSTRRARPAGPRACASRCPARRSVIPRRHRSRSREGIGRYGVGAGSVYLSPAPLYHAAPARLLDVDAPARRDGRGDGAVRPGAVPRAHRAPPRHARPVRADDVRAHAPAAARASASATTCPACELVVHAAAPCPVPVKRQMIEWWGPIIDEYYAGTEDIGSTVHHAAGVAGAPRLGRAARWTSATSSATTARSCRRARPASSTSPAAGRSSTTTTRRRRRRSSNDQGLADPRRHRLPRRGRLPLPHRPPGAHDHLRRRQHLSAGGRERARRRTPRWSTSP